MYTLQRTHIHCSIQEEDFIELLYHKIIQEIWYILSKQGTLSALSCLHGPGILEVLQTQGIRIQADPYSSDPDPQHRTCGKQARHSIGITLSTRPCNVGGATKVW